MRLLITVLLGALAVACDEEATTTSTTATTSTSTTAATVDGGAVDCGEDFSSLDQVGPRSVAKQCFLDANSAGKPATLTIHDVRATGEFTALLTSNPDRTVEVVPADGSPPSTCAGLAPDERQVFVLAGCR